MDQGGAPFCPHQNYLPGGCLAGESGSARASGVLTPLPSSRFIFACQGFWLVTWFSHHEPSNPWYTGVPGTHMCQ